MSLKKYIESKSKPKIIVSLEKYKEQLYADLSSLLLKPDERISEVCKHLTSRKMISSLKNEIKIVPEDVDEAVEKSIRDSELILKKMARNIELAVESIINWQNPQIKIEALYSSDCLAATKANVVLGESYTVNFVYEETPLSFNVSSVSESENIPKSLKNNAQDLILKLQSNPKYNKILTFYLKAPNSDREYFERAKRDLSLGIETIISNKFTLNNFCKESVDFDIWKIKIKENLIYECSENQFKIIDKEAPINWIEKYE